MTAPETRTRALPVPGRDAARQGRLMVGLVIIALTLWLALPALRVEYIEGFQPETVLNAHALLGRDMALGDGLYPFNARFFLQTRLGTSLAVLGLQSVSGMTGLTAFRIIGLGSFALLLGVLLVLTRRHRIGPVLALACCILFPPVFEAAYFPNDNMPSAALASLAWLLFSTRPSIPRTVLTGLLMGAAAVLRLDALLIAPAFAMVLFTDVRSWPARILRCCIAGTLVAVVLFLAYRACGLSFLDTFAVIARATALWDRPNRILHNDLRTALLGITAPGALAWLLGVAAFARARRWRDVALAVAVPLLYVVAYRALLVETRYLLPLSPFVLPPMAEGLRSILRWHGRRRPLVLAAFGACLLVWAAPPVGVPAPLLADDEGPRLVVGRLWNPLATLWWQSRLRAGDAAVDAVVEQAAKARHPVIVTGYWTADRVVMLSLIEHGFTLRPERTPEACRGIAESLVRGPVTLLQIRTHVPFVPKHSERLTWETLGLPCLRAADPDATHVLLVDSGPLDSPALAFTGPGLLFSASAGTGGGLVARMLPGLRKTLTGLVVAEVPADDVAGALDTPLPPEDRQPVLDTLARRSELLR